MPRRVLQREETAVDLNLVQSLDLGQRLAEQEGRTGPGWDRLREALSAAMDAFIEDVDDVGYPKPQTGDRIDRTDSPDPETVQQVRGALISLRDYPDDGQAALAADLVEELNGQVGG